MDVYGTKNDILLDENCLRYFSLLETIYMNKETMYSRLKELSITYESYTHEPLFTVDQVCSIEIPGASCKNLFLKDSKKQFWLVVAVGSTKIPLKNLGTYLRAPELRFAGPEQLMECLGVEPGSVTPFGLINDTKKQVAVILDKALFNHELVGFHPLKNDETIVLNPHDLKKFIDSLDYTYHEIDFSEIPQ